MPDNQSRAEAALAVRRETATMPLQPQSFGDATMMAEYLSKSSLVPDKLRGKPADILLSLMWSKELGIGPAQGLAAVHVIEGKASLAADLIVGLVKRSPDCEYFQLLESTPERCTYETKRRGNPKPTTLTWTIQDAQRAGLTGKRNWERHPDAMLRARTSKALAVAEYPDIAMGLISSEEAEDMDLEAPAYQNPIAATTAPENPPAVDAYDEPDLPEWQKKQNIAEAQTEEPEVYQDQREQIAEAVTQRDAEPPETETAPAPEEEPAPPISLLKYEQELSDEIANSTDVDELREIGKKLKNLPGDDFDMYRRLFEKYQLRRGVLDNESA